MKSLGNSMTEQDIQCQLTQFFLWLSSDNAREKIEGEKAGEKKDIGL